MKKSYILIAAVFMVAVMAGCLFWYWSATGEIKDPVKEPLFTAETYPRVDASLAIHPLVDAIAAVETDSSDKPTTPVTITSIEIKTYAE